MKAIVSCVVTVHMLVLWDILLVMIVFQVHTFLTWVLVFVTSVLVENMWTDGDQMI